MCFILVGELRILLFMYKLPCHMIDMNRNHLYVPQISLNLHVHFLSGRIVLQSDRPEFFTEKIAVRDQACRSEHDNA